LKILAARTSRQLYRMAKSNCKMAARMLKKRASLNISLALRPTTEQRATPAVSRINLVQSLKNTAPAAYFPVDSVSFLFGIVDSGWQTNVFNCRGIVFAKTRCSYPKSTKPRQN
jgi:hypothetical protein